MSVLDSQFWGAFATCTSIAAGVQAGRGQFGIEIKYLIQLASLLQPVFARSSITKARNRTTIPALLLNQNEQIRTKSKRHLYKLLCSIP